MRCWVDVECNSHTGSLALAYNTRILSTAKQQTCHANQTSSLRPIIFVPHFSVQGE